MSTRIGRLSVILVSALLTVAGFGFDAVAVRAQDDDAANVPKNLLRVEPFDRITLVDGTVLLVDPVLPRPLPVYDPEAEAKARRKAERLGREEPSNNVGLPGEGKTKIRRPDADLPPPVPETIDIHLTSGEVRDYKLQRAGMKTIEYFEDMLLAESDRLIVKQDFARAFEHLLRVKGRSPEWNGLAERVDRLAFEEGSSLLTGPEAERGLAMLLALKARRPNFKGLADAMVKAFGGRIASAFDSGAYDRSRRLLRDLESLAPEHPAVAAARERFVTRARELIRAAQGQTDPAAKLDSLTEALRVWPDIEGGEAAYRAAFEALPTLDVAVVNLPTALAPWADDPASTRSARLIHLPILAGVEEDAIAGKANNQLAAAFEVGELGRRLTISLRDGLTWSDGSRPVAPIDLARALNDASNPSSPGYMARWATLVEQVEPKEENRLEVRLRRTTLRPAAWFLNPIGPAHSGKDGWVTVAAKTRKPVGAGPYAWSAATDGQVTYSHTGSAPIARIRERVIADDPVEALIRGDVSLVEHVPPARVADLMKQNGVKVGTYTHPMLHRIALDGRVPMLKLRTLRRGLSMAIDRKTELEETVLKRPADAVNLVSDGPMPKGSYADAAGVKPLESDPILARLLIAAARRELGDTVIRLKLDYPDLPEVRAVIPHLIEAWKLAGVEVQARERPWAELERGLRAGERFEMAYRVGPCAEPALDLGPLVCPGYDAPPKTEALSSVASPRILQLLLALEQAGEWPAATGLAAQIDRETRDELPVIPLWQVEDHRAWRDRLTGPSEVADDLYQGIATWTIAPWVPRDPPAPTESANP